MTEKEIEKQRKEAQEASGWKVTRQDIINLNEKYDDNR